MIKKLSILGVTLLLSAAIFAQSKVKVTAERNADNSVTFYYEKFSPGTYTIEVRLANLSNTQSSDFRRVIKNEHGILYRMTPINKNRPINY